MSRRARVARTEHPRRPTRSGSRTRRTRSLWTALGLGLAVTGLATVPAGTVQAATPQPVGPQVRTVVLTYNDDNAPDFQQQIATSTSIWNAVLDNVTIVDTDGPADFVYYEGNDPEGSHTSTDGHGHGYVFLDLPILGAPNELRIISHEIGHVLGLPDHYSGPCSEVMSGAGPGAEGCTNAYPDANESARVDQLWVNGLAAAPHRRTAAVR